MANKFKTITKKDHTTRRTLLHEAIPITGSMISGTYVSTLSVATNTKNYSHGMFQSYYDYPYLSSSANHLFDVTCGHSILSVFSASTTNQNSKKINIYNQMAQICRGYDDTGSIKYFTQDGTHTGARMNETIFMNFSRLLTKDEIKKESFSILINSGGLPSNPHSQLTVSDPRANTGYLTNSPAGEWAIVHTNSADPNPNGTSGVGHLYYQAGVLVLTASIFSASAGSVANSDNHFGPNTVGLEGTQSYAAVATGSTIQAVAEGFANRIENIQFNNTTQLHSSIYFCRVNHNEFNHSSNPTYTSGSKYVVKNKSSDSPLSYITTVGLYSQNNVLLAVAKLSEPLLKTPETEYTLRVRLDY